jgi:hypothetical protein
MKTIISSTLLAVFAIISFSISAGAQTTYTDKGTNTTYTLGNGDSLYIASGTYTGVINTWTAGSKITVAQNANFKPSSFSDNKSKLKVLGTAVLPALTTGAGFDLKNYGNITVNGAAEMNGGSQTWFNNFGATITLKGKMSINQDNSSFTNDGTVIAKSDFFLYAKSTINNTNTITVEGDFKTSKGTLNNSGKFYSLKNITLSGSLVVNNSCKMIADNGINIDNSNTTVYNSGFLWASNSKSNSYITNSGTIISSGTGKVKSVAFTNWGTIKGNGWFYFTGGTRGDGTIGTSGVTTDSVRIYDVTRTNPATIFDVQNGTIRANVKYVVFAAPDTSASAMTSCSAQFVSASNLATLPVVWNYFEAKLVNSVPELNWSAQQDPGTVYELQRSYDNSVFTKITSVIAETNKSVYQYADKDIDNKKQVIYYRIKATEPDGSVKFTPVKIVKTINSNPAVTQIYPNPFTSQLTIAYTATANEKITIRIYNANSQILIVKSSTANKGTTTFTLTEVANFTHGLYIVEISNGSNITATQKIIKN